MVRADADGAIVALGPPDATRALHFDFLPADLAARVVRVAPGSLRRDLPRLAAAAAVIVVRGLDAADRRGLAAGLRAAGAPLFWFLDDDPIALNAEGAGFEGMTEARFAELAGRCEAVLAATPTLAGRLARLHPTILLWPCRYDRAALSPTSPWGDNLRIAVFGGTFRREGYQAQVGPAVRDLARRRPLRLRLAAGLAGADDAGAEVAPFEADFDRFLAGWRGFAPNLVLHPAGASGNMPNKGCASLIVARLCGALPIVAAEDPAFSQLGEAEGVLRAGSTAMTWSEALARASDPTECAGLGARLDRWLEATHGPESIRTAFAAVAARSRGGAVRGGPARTAIAVAAAAWSRRR